MFWTNRATPVIPSGSSRVPALKQATRAAIGVACCSLMITVIPFCSTKRDVVPACSCLTTTAAVGTFTGLGGSVFEGVETLGRPRPLCEFAGLGKSVVMRRMIDKTGIEIFNRRTVMLLAYYCHES